MGSCCLAAEACSTRTLKHRAVVIRRNVNPVAELEAARLNTCDRLFGGHPQLSRWPSRLWCVPNVWPAPDLQVDFYDLVSISLQ